LDGQLLGYEADEDIKQEENWSKRWHSLDFWGWTVQAFTVSGIYYWFTQNPNAFAIPFFIGSLRTIVLNLTINRLIRTVPWNYLGERELYGIFKGRETLYYVLAFFVLLLSGSLLIFL
jgi:hypothetical protein